MQPEREQEEVEELPQWHVREGGAADWPFVFRTILTGLTSDPHHVYDHPGDAARYSGASPSAHEPHLSRAVFMAEYHDRLEEALGRSYLRVAETADGSPLILGFALLEAARSDQPRDCIHYVHVKKGTPPATWRRHGIAATLLHGINPNECDASHLRPVTWGWISKKWPKLVYNPFRMWPTFKVYSTRRSNG